MKKKYTLFAVLFASILLLTTACELSAGDDGGTVAVPNNIITSYSSAVAADGADGTANTTELTLTFSVDPTTLAASDITVTGATKGALSGSGLTRALAISDITVGNGATVSVAIASPSGFTISGSPQTAVVYKAVIGTPYQGGIIAYILQSGDPGYVSGETHGLIAATADQSSWIVWISGGSTQTTLNGGTSTVLGNGQANTTAMMNQADYTGGAAKVCDDYTNTDTGTGVYSDWYLPSKDELNKLYLNRAAVGGFGSFPVPVLYWSSSEYNSSNAWYQNFSDGSQSFTSKFPSYFIPVRAVRAF